MIEELYVEGMGYSYFNRMKEAEEEANKFKENCNYLEQENKELNNTIKKFRWDNPYFDLYNNVVFQRDKLEQENAELKNKNICRETCEYFKRICNENTLLIKYRSALEEIKKFLDNSLMVTNVGTKQMIYYADFFEFKNDLKEKIDEVLNEN